MQTHFLINGSWHGSPACADVRNPFTGEAIASIALAEATHVEDALEAACATAGPAALQPAHERSRVLAAVADGIQRRASEFADLIVSEAGKPVTYAEVEVERAASTFRFAAALAISDEGSGIRMDASSAGVGHQGFLRRFPVGVILGITPFNFPLNLVAHKVAPCIATGNTMILKPALRTPLTALLLGEVLVEAGTLPGQINIVPFDHAHVDTLLADPRVKMLSFTGGVSVGWELKTRAKKQKVALELGGNAAVIIEPDSDWKAAIPIIAKAAFGNAGQSCISVQRILVHQSIAAAFREDFAASALRDCPVGDPRERSTVVGPMIDEAARRKVVHWIREALDAGAKALTPIEESGLSILSPIVLTHVPRGAAVDSEEVFAPVAVLTEYSDFEQALDLVNDSPFGLQAGVFTRDLDKALRAHEKLEVGGVLVNQVPTFRVENMPYGGVKDSGFGREGLRYAMEEMTEPRALIIRRSPCT
ncbi:MAG: aldehyde dehydrogenase family protein [Terrimicrobiaceae bacterium]